MKHLLLKALCALLPFTAIAVENITPIDDSRWLISTEKQGLVLINEDATKAVLRAGRYEKAASLPINNDKYFVAAIRGNNLDLFTLQQQKLELLQTQSEEYDSFVGICLYHEQSSGTVHAILIKDQQQVEQRAVYNLTHSKPMQQSIRNLPISQGLTSCAVDSDNEIIYIAEESIGVWSFTADPEAEMGRKPVALVAPYGKLAGEIKNLSILTDGSLVIANSENASFHLAQGGSLQEFSLPQQAEAVAGNWHKDNQLKVLSGDKLSELQLTQVKANQHKLPAKMTFHDVVATVETQPVMRFGDAADDPAIWVHPTVPESSLILGTDKKSGLAVYNMSGEQTQFIPTGRINNIDIRNGYTLNGNDVAIAAASNRDDNSISLYSISAEEGVAEAGNIATTLDEVYGLCMYQSAESMHVFINDKDGRYHQYRLLNDGRLSGELVTQFELPDQPEGCVANDETGDLFLGVEDRGIWHAVANDSGTGAVQKIVDIEGKIKDDVEGLALYQTPAKTYLVVSSQGNDSYAVFNAKEPYGFVGSFKVRANFDKGIDGASETDGLEVTSANLGGEFGQGALVVQDGRNIMPVQPQNFKLIPFDSIIKQLNLKL